jgi:ribonuclease P protein component
VNFQFKDKSRLSKSIEFKRAFGEGRRLRGRMFGIYYVKNHGSCARVGLAIPKKNIRYAVNRNYIKRIVREGFRLNQSKLCGYDIVVVAINKPGNLTKKCLRTQLDSLWQQVSVACKKPASFSLNPTKC